MFNWKLSDDYYSIFLSISREKLKVTFAFVSRTADHVKSTIFKYSMTQTSNSSWGKELPYESAKLKIERFVLLRFFWLDPFSIFLMRFSLLSIVPFLLARVMIYRRSFEETLSSKKKVIKMKAGETVINKFIII